VAWQRKVSARGVALRAAALGLAVFGAAAAATPAGAVETIGGPGGEAFRIACGAGRYVVGLTGRSGDWMDQVAPICVKIDGHGRWVGSPTVGPSAGGSGGVAFTMQCPRDSVVTSYYGYSQEYVINIGLTCRHDGPNGAEWRTPVPAQVGNLSVSSSEGGGCGQGQAADAIIGGAWSYVDRFGLSCAGYLVMPPPDPAPAPAPVIVAPAWDEEAKARSPLFEALGQFSAPMINGYAVDLCLNWGTGCGQPAADEFCRRQGFSASVEHTVQNDAPPTLVLGDNVVCDGAFCDRFSAIACR
jgi:hypothetical protein